jgi:hypothetical protein
LVFHTLGLEQKLAAVMRKMQSAKFESVLHPIFEKVEMTLIVGGGVLCGIRARGLQLATPRRASSNTFNTKCMPNTGSDSGLSPKVSIELFL